MIPDSSTALLLSRWRAGDESAADHLFRRYAGGLLSVARDRLAAGVARREDAEDVVQSAYRSFFAAAKGGDYVLERSGDLWGLLVAITLHKLRDRVKWHRRAKRSVDREQSFGPADAPAARDASPLEALALADEVEQMARDLGPVVGRVLELRLQGYSLEEIADETGRSVRTICRSLDQIKRHLIEARDRCRGGLAGAAP